MLLADKGRRESAARQADPLTWSVETGSTEPARPIVTDLLTMRATRDGGYYHIDTLLEWLEITRRSARRHAA